MTDVVVERERHGLVVTERKRKPAVEVLPEATEGSMEIRERIKELSKTIDTAYWTMSELLYSVYKQAEFRMWGYSTFAEYVDKELNFTVRKAQYLVEIWRLVVVELGNGKTKYLDRIKDIGWSKLSTIAKELTPENIDDWYKRAQELTVCEINDFKTKAKKIAVDDTVRKIEAGEIPKEQDQLHTISFKLYSDQYKTVLDAIEYAGRTITKPEQSYRLAFICQEFLSTNDWEEDPRANIMSHLRKIEALTGLNLMAQDKETGETIYNGLATQVPAVEKKPRKQKKGRVRG